VISADCKVTPRAPGIQAWDACSPDEKKVFARMMEIYAGYLEQTDYNVGRVVKAIDDLGTWKTYNHYPVGWA
jgi:arylsulfatase